MMTQPYNWPRHAYAHLKPMLKHLGLATVGILSIGFISGVMAAPAGGGGLPNLTVNIAGGAGGNVSTGIQIMILLTVLTLLPSLLIMCTAFTRIVIVMSMIRQAIGTPQLPPNQILVGLSLILTLFVMAPTFEKINNDALQPYLNNKIPQQVAFDRLQQPLRVFMFKQTGKEDIALFTKLAKLKKPRTTADVPTYVLLPAFAISEMKIAFQFGFVIFLPFIVIDMVVSSILVSMGMLFLPPMTISLPFKIILFVLVNGWELITESLVRGFR